MLFFTEVHFYTDVLLRPTCHLCLSLRVLFHFVGHRVTLIFSSAPVWMNCQGLAHSANMWCPIHPQLSHPVLTAYWRRMRTTVSSTPECICDQLHCHKNYGIKEKCFALSRPAVPVKCHGIRWPCLQMEYEKRGIDRRFRDGILEVQQKSGFKNQLLERKLGLVHNDLETTQAQLGEVMASANLDPLSLQIVTRRMEVMTSVCVFVTALNWLF